MVRAEFEPNLNISLNISISIDNGRNKLPNFQKPVEIRREDFGPGRTGEKAFELINAGAGCEFKIKRDEMCNKRATQTLDMDIFGQVEVMPMCSDAHGKLQAIRGILELRKQNLDGCLSKNGFGRS